MPEQVPLSPVGVQAAYWNSPAARSWTDQHERQDRALAALADAALAVAAPRPGERVLDIGCATGTTVIELASRVGPGGHVLGADIAAPSVARAGERIAAAGLRQAEVICADVATHQFEAAAFDLVFSRLGVMFFEDPVAAFANVYRATKPGGRLALAVFRPASENPWPSGAMAAVRHLLPPSPPPQPGEPGMFAWGDQARVRGILESVGFRGVSFTPVDLDYRLAGAAGGAVEATEFALLFGPLTRVLPSQPPETQVAVRAALEAYFTGLATPEGVVLPSAFWIVGARR